MSAELATTAFTFAARPSRFEPVARTAPERILGCDMSPEGLPIAEKTLTRVEAHAATATLAEFAAMAVNWDGYGASAISAEAIHNCRQALAQLLRQTPAPDITPNPNGTISLEWQSTAGLAHVEIGKTRYSFYVKTREGIARVEDGDASRIAPGVGALITALVYPRVQSGTAITQLNYAVRHEPAGF